LAALDAFEEVPHLYVRQSVCLAGSWPQEVEAYFLSPQADCLAGSETAWDESAQSE